MLVRRATLKLSPPPRGWDSWSVSGDPLLLGVPITVVGRLHARESDHVKFDVMAVQELKYLPKVTADNLVVVPSKARESAEATIEAAANIVAVAQACRREIGSPLPVVGLIGTTERATTWLAARTGLLHAEAKGSIHVADILDVEPAALPSLDDRLDGVALLAEVFAQDGAMGRFHDLVRLFERAFASPPARIAEPLSKFLQPRFAYSIDELSVWLDVYRDAATHADQRTHFLVEKDIRRVIPRMEQAAADVLYNKENWRSKDAARREKWFPRVGLVGKDERLFRGAHQSSVTFTWEFMDEFDAFPLDMTVPHGPPTNVALAGIARDWWPEVDDSPMRLEESLDFWPDEAEASSRPDE